MLPVEIRESVGDAGDELDSVNVEFRVERDWLDKELSEDRDDSVASSSSWEEPDA